MNIYKLRCDVLKLSKSIKENAKIMSYLIYYFKFIDIKKKPEKHS